jgi:hypothetical protein
MKTKIVFPDGHEEISYEKIPLNKFTEKSLIDFGIMFIEQTDVDGGYRNPWTAYIVYANGKKIGASVDNGAGKMFSMYGKHLSREMVEASLEIEKRKSKIEAFK